MIRLHLAPARASIRSGMLPDLMTQSLLATAIGTTQSVISRLEDADYGGHSLRLLRRVAEATGQRLELRFVPLGRKG